MMILLCCVVNFVVMVYISPSRQAPVLLPCPACLPPLLLFLSFAFAPALSPSFFEDSFLWLVNFSSVLVVIQNKNRYYKKVQIQIGKKKKSKFFIPFFYIRSQFLFGQFLKAYDFFLKKMVIFI